MTPKLQPVVLYAGSFDPLHIGHTSLAHYLLTDGYAREVWVMPTPGNPLKKQQTCFSYEERCRQIDQAFVTQPNISLCRIEAQLPKPHYTVRTLQALRTLHPHTRFALLIGADNWQVWQQWYRHERIEQLCTLYVYPRTGSSLPAHSPRTGIIFLHDAPLWDISSSAIRLALQEGRDLSQWLPCPEKYKQYQEYVREDARP